MAEAFVAGILAGCKREGKKSLGNPLRRVASALSELIPPSRAPEPLGDSSAFRKPKGTCHEFSTG